MAGPVRSKELAKSERRKVPQSSEFTHQETKGAGYSEKLNKPAQKTSIENLVSDVRHIEKIGQPEPRNGPDQVLPTTSVKVWEAHHPVDMNSRATAQGMASDEPISVHTMLKTVAEKHPNHPALAVKKDGMWKYKTYHEYYSEARTVAKAFIKLGLERFRGVCIMGFNSPEWFITHFGAVFAGGLSSGVYITNSPEACRHIAENCMAQIIVIENVICLNKFLVMKRFLPNIKAIVQWSGVPGAPGVLSWRELIAIGLAEQDNDLEERLSLQAVNQCCNLVYTSGTTGLPKGVMISQDGLTLSGKALHSIFRREEGTEDFVSYLPLSHISAQVRDIYMSLSSVATVYFAQPDALKGSLIETLLEVQPTYLIAVPRIWEKIYEKLQEIETSERLAKKQVANWAKEKGYSYYSALLSGRSLSSNEMTSFSIAKELFINKIRTEIGLNRINFAGTGTAPISKDILVYLMSIGIPVCEGAAMSETTNLGCYNDFRPSRYKIGSIGKPLPQINLVLKPHPMCNPGEGEITYKGRSVCMGYLGNPDQTNETIDDDGRLYSGDIGRVDDEGFVYITGRIKEIIITAGGENIPPKLIEFHIKREIPFLSFAFLVGDRRK